MARVWLLSRCGRGARLLIETLHPIVRENAAAEVILCICTRRTRVIAAAVPQSNQPDVLTAGMLPQCADLAPD